MIGQVERLQKILAVENSGQAAQNKIITFASGKGGTGKTFVSVNVAHTLAHEGYKVLFIDFDSNLSNADIMLNISPSLTILDYFTGRNLIQNVITPGEGNIDYIFGDSGRIEYPRISVDLVGRFIKDINGISANYDFVIIDTGAGINSEIIFLLSKSHQTVFVSTPEPTAIMDTYAVIKLLKSKSGTGDYQLLVNMSESEEQGLEAFENLNTALNHFLKVSANFVGFINYDSKVRKSVIDQNLFVRTYPKSEISYQIRGISTKLAGRRQLANINQGS